MTPLQQRGLEIVQKLRGEFIEIPQERSGGDPKIGVALGGGSARGLTHVPFIEAIEELGLKPHVIAGTSIGALIGAGWASGMNGAELREHTISVLGTLRIITARLWGAQVRGLGNLFNMQLDGRRVVDAFLPDPFPYEFSELKTRFFHNLAFYGLVRCLILVEKSAGKAPTRPRPQHVIQQQCFLFLIYDDRGYGHRKGDLREPDDT
jgi:NTE family protein